MSMERQEGRRIPAPLGYRVGDDADAAQIAAAVLAVWNEIDDALTPVVGPRGLVALYQRALHLGSAACRDAAAGSGGLVSATDPDALHALLARRSADDAAAIGSAFLHTFHGLLSSLVGPALTEQLLRSAWDHPSRGASAQDTPP